MPGMKVDDFKMRLKTLPFPVLKDQPMAQNFIGKISKKEYEERYNVSEALKHPFITGNKDDEIPLSIHESYKGFDHTTDIIHVNEHTFSCSNCSWGLERWCLIGEATLMNSTGLECENLSTTMRK